MSPLSLHEWIRTGGSPSDWEPMYEVHFINEDGFMDSLHVYEKGLSLPPDKLPEELKFLRLYANHVKGIKPIPDDVIRQILEEDVYVMNTEIVGFVDDKTEVCIRNTFTMRDNCQHTAMNKTIPHTSHRGFHMETVIMKRKTIFFVAIVFFVTFFVTVSSLYAETITYSYDSAHRLTRAEYDPSGIVVEYAYDSRGNRTSKIVSSNQAPYTPSNPSPGDTASDVQVTTQLSWTGGDPDPNDVVSYDVYFDTATPPTALVSETQLSEEFDPGVLDPLTPYYWKIVSEDHFGLTTDGPVWSFTTMDNHPPNVPSNPSPQDRQSNVSTTTDLSWTGGDPDMGDTVTYDVYFDKSNPPAALVSQDQSPTTYDPGTLIAGTPYYWKIVAEDNHNTVSEGPVWTFNTAPLALQQSFRMRRHTER